MVTLTKWLYSAMNHLHTLNADDVWSKQVVCDCITADLQRMVDMVEGKVLVTPVTHENNGEYCTTFPAVYGCGATAEESRKVFEQRLEEVERDA